MRESIFENLCLALPEEVRQKGVALAGKKRGNIRTGLVGQRHQGSRSQRGGKHCRPPIPAPLPDQCIAPTRALHFGNNQIPKATILFRGAMVSLARGARRLATTVVVPLIAGAGLAAFCLLALSSTVGSVGRRGTTSGDVLDDARPGSGRGQATARGRYEHFVAAAAAHEVGAEQELAHAQRLRTEAATAKSKAAALQSSLAQLLDEEANRDKAAARLAAKAHTLNSKAIDNVVSKHALSSAWNQALAAARAKRDAFLANEKAAGKDKVAAKALLDQERALFEKSYQMLDKEAKAQVQVARRNEELDAEKRKVRHIRDHEHVVSELPHQEQQAQRHAQQQAQQQQQQQKEQQKEQQHAAAKAQSAEQQADKKAEARSKRPLWGDRKWPSYYDNALTDPGSEKLFDADKPSHPAPRQMV